MAQVKLCSAHCEQRGGIAEPDASQPRTRTGSGGLVTAPRMETQNRNNTLTVLGLRLDGEDTGKKRLKSQ